MLFSEPVNNRTTRALPDLKICRAADLVNTFAECLVEKPQGCQYAIPFGYSFLCGNPQRTTIIDNTKHLHAKD